MIDKEKKKAYNKKYRQTIKYQKYQKKYRKLPEVKERRKIQRELPENKRKRKNYYMNPEIKERRKLQRQKPKVKKWQKEYRQRPEIKERDRKSYKTEKYKLKKKKYIKEHRRLPQIKIKTNLSNRLRDSIRKYSKSEKIMSAKKYGIDYNIIINHLKPFPKNISKYHIDHIRPLCSFNFINKDGTQNIKEIKKAFSPNNIQWLLAHDNLSKGGKWNG